MCGAPCVVFGGWCMASVCAGVVMTMRFASWVATWQRRSGDSMKIGRSLPSLVQPDVFGGSWLRLMFVVNMRIPRAHWHSEHRASGKAVCRETMDPVDWHETLIGRSAI